MHSVGQQVHTWGVRAGGMPTGVVGALHKQQIEALRRATSRIIAREVYRVPLRKFETHIFQFMHVTIRLHSLCATACLLCLVLLDSDSDETGLDPAHRV